MCSKVSLSLKRHLPNRLRQRDKRVRPEIKEIGQQLIKSAHCKCERDCYSGIGLSRQTKRCSRTTNQRVAPYSLETEGCQ